MNELLLEAEYAEIIIELLNQPFRIGSVVKLVFMSFCVRNEKRTSYGLRKTDFVDVFLENINIKLLSHPEELKSIFEVINKLKRNGWIEISNGTVRLSKEQSICQCGNRFLYGCKEREINPIIEINKLDDQAFIEEVLRHV